MEEWIVKERRMDVWIDGRVVDKMLKHLTEFLYFCLEGLLAGRLNKVLNHPAGKPTHKQHGRTKSKQSAQH
jgi:hypothetical protein